MNGVISLGEALIDFTPLDDQNRDFRKNPGGAPANVAVALSRLGVDASFVGKVGNDVLGSFVKEKLATEDVNIDNMLLTDEARTALTFVTLDQDGDRSFDFYIDPSADRFLRAEEIDQSLFTKNKIFHCGSISLIDQPARSATEHAVKLAKENGLLVSYDPNLRMGLWSSREEAKERIVSILDQVDVLKVAEEELEFITGEQKIEAGVEAVQAKYKIPLIFVTYGGEGAYYYRNKLGFVPAMDVEVVDTTGAGDGFVSGILYNLSQWDKQISELDSDDLEEMTKFANISGGLAASKSGAMAALPALGQIKRRL